jgi:hypothetical protein
MDAQRVLQLHLSIARVALPSLSIVGWAPSLFNLFTLLGLPLDNTDSIRSAKENSTVVAIPSPERTFQSNSLIIQKFGHYEYANLILQKDNS